jgi:hypothetical protein
VLEFLLVADFPGVDELRRQAKVVSVVGRCPCGCATINLSVDGAPVGPPFGAVPVEARSREVYAGGPLELMLFVRAGRLASLEIVDYANELPVEFPPPSDFERPSATSQ